MLTKYKWKHNVILFMVGQGITLFGSSLVYFAVMWYITLETKSGTMMMLIMVAGMLPMFLVSPFAGVWADRYNKKHLINISDAFTAVVTLAMAIMFMAGYELMWLLLLCLAARAVAQGVQMPAFTALIPEMVPEEHLTRINGINGSIQTITTFASPALGGVLLAIAPIHLLMLIDVFTAVIGISILLFFVKVPIHPIVKEHKSGAKQYIKEIGEGLKYMVSHTFLKKALVISALINFLIATTAMTPLLVARNWGDNVWSILGAIVIGAEHRLAITEMGYSGGLVIGGLIIGVWGGFKNKNHTFALFTLLAGIAVAGLGLFTNFWAFTLFMLFAGTFLSMRSAAVMSMLQSNIDRSYMGRSMSVLLMMASLTVQLGMLLWGPLSDAVSIEWLLAGSGLLILIMGISIFFDKALLKAGLIIKDSDTNDIADDAEKFT